MRCDVITLFPEMIVAALGESILKRAQQAGFFEVCVRPLREFTSDKHHIVDDAPYGGGPGMVLKPGPIFSALDQIVAERGDVRVIIPSPQGKLFDHKMAGDFSRESRSLVFICGHYEGIDARVVEGLHAEEVSVGDYILTGGELAALVMIDASARFLPGVLGDVDSLQEESFSASLLEYPHYTRPDEFRGMRVPDVLKSGNHRAIRLWRRQQSVLNTLRKRPDLLREAVLTEEEREWMNRLAHSAQEG